MDKRISVLCIMQKYLPILRKINGLESIINAVYPEGLGKYKDIASKKRYILKNIEKVCKAMQDKKTFFKRYELSKNSKGDIVYIFHRN